MATRPHVRSLIKESGIRADESFVVGGPPCQAYSIAGRSRNGAKRGWSLEKDHRSTLYEEYLHAIAVLSPLGFVMENVRGLLSAEMNGSGVFERILGDLSSPARALGMRGGKVYRLVPFVRSAQAGRSLDQLDMLGNRLVAEDFLVRADKHGVPQSRTRLIVIGIREDVQIASERVGIQETRGRLSVRDAIESLPRLRSGLSRKDDRDSWFETLVAAESSGWFAKVERDVRVAMKEAIAKAARLDSRGSEFLPRGGAGRLDGIANHSARGHMAADLHRYLFAAAWASVHGKSPTLKDFPSTLLPDHRNVEDALEAGNFSDRFRVQSWDSPSTTVVSHISKDGHYYIHPDPSQCRSLTVREAARLQTFPDDYVFCGPRTAQYHQVGNAVPVELARRIASAVAQLIGL